jgi:hypothetical protein
MIQRCRVFGGFPGLKINDFSAQVTHRAVAFNNLRPSNPLNYRGVLLCPSSKLTLGLYRTITLIHRFSFFRRQTRSIITRIFQLAAPQAQVRGAIPIPSLFRFLVSSLRSCHANLLWVAHKVFTALCAFTNCVLFVPRTAKRSHATTATRLWPTMLSVKLRDCLNLGALTAPLHTVTFYWIEMGTDCRPWQRLDLATEESSSAISGINTITTLKLSPRVDLPVFALNPLNLKSLDRSFSITAFADRGRREKHELNYSRTKGLVSWR